MSHLSRMKNPDLPCPTVAAALRAYGYVLPNGYIYKTYKLIDYRAGLCDYFKPIYSPRLHESSTKCLALSYKI